ncbi:hypothetical protein SAMN04487970_103931 [Paenibacillus tianmuensis]|uniref:Uncharacterized protein n=1 Tax=Paenibacillus tianmuensis TaxID=624147 RepID=A0A1G4T038_9BACL|nr:hypothetical protein SAMN04487970_103931 [Paenibacillus tianmuensis]
MKGLRKKPFCVMRRSMSQDGFLNLEAGIYFCCNGNNVTLEDIAKQLA